MTDTPAFSASGFDSFYQKLLAEVSDVEGYLSPSEVQFLSLAASYPTASGKILEIGTFKGKSTIVLSKSALQVEETIVQAVDPMTAPCETDPNLHGSASSYEDFQRNITRHQVADSIHLHRQFSHELASNWNQPLRLLWIDGDHTYAGTKKDFDGFACHLSDGGIIAIHDTLHAFEGGLRVFAENILLSPSFGACGFVGSIGWAQYNHDPNKNLRYHQDKIRLYRALSRLIPLVALNRKLRPLEKKKFKLFRALVPHGAIDPLTWTRTVERSAPENHPESL
ncbi:MAG TPA: class I SAM-dependent methyltransferase [Bacteroidia bacterium]|nr:class I SAM-dependent methyltransferase [Bacteroidia bacterium]